MRRLLQPSGAISAEVLTLLKQTGHQLVLAESCTGGLCSAMLTSISGASEAFCGSAVVYQIPTKESWLGLKKKLFVQTPNAVSGEIAEAMALAALKKTPRATLALSITGTLSDVPHARSQINAGGHVFIGLAVLSTKKKRNSKQHVFAKTLQSEFFILPQVLTRRSRQELPKKFHPDSQQLRTQRQSLASFLILHMVRSLLSTDFKKVRNQ